MYVHSLVAIGHLDKLLETSFFAEESLNKSLLHFLWFQVKNHYFPKKVVFYIS